MPEGTPIVPDSNERQLLFLSKFHIFPPPENVPAKTILALYGIDEQYKEMMQVTTLLHSKDDTIYATKKRMLHCETLGLVLSMCMIGVLRFTHNNYTTACGIPLNPGLNQTTPNATNCTSATTKLPNCLPNEDATFVFVLALLALLCNIFCAVLLAWHNFSFTVLRRQLKNYNCLFILFLVLISCYIELQYPITPLLHQQWVMTLAYFTSAMTFLLLDDFKHMPRYGLLCVTALMLAIEASEIIRHSVLLCCEMSDDYVLSSWLKTVHFNIVICLVPIATAVVKDVDRKEFYFVIVHPLRRVVRHAKRASYNFDQVSKTWRNSTVGGDIELPQRWSLEKAVDLTNAYPQTMQTYDVAAGLRLLTLVGLPSPTVENKWTPHTMHHVADILNGNDSHPGNEEIRDEMELRRRVWGILTAYMLEAKLWNPTFAPALLKDAEQFSGTQNSALSSSLCSTNAGKKTLVFVLLLTYATLLGISFAPSNWRPSKVDACQHQVGIKQAAEWYVVAVVVLASIGLFAYGRLVCSNCSKRNGCQVLRAPNVMMFLMSLGGLLFVDMFVPETSMSGLNSFVYVSGLVMFVFTDAHVWRSRVLAGSLGCALLSTTVANVYWASVCVGNNQLVFSSVSVSKCDVHRSLYLSVVLLSVEGVVTMLLDGRNERLWFVAVHGDRETGDGDGTTSEVKQKFLKSRFHSTQNMLSNKIRKRKTEFMAKEEQKRWGVALRVGGEGGAGGGVEEEEGGNGCGM